MRYDPYSKTNRLILDGMVLGFSFCLAYFLRYEGSIPPNYAHQMHLLVLPMIASRLLMGYAFRVHRTQWKYVSVFDATRLTAAYASLSLGLLVLRFTLPQSLNLFRIGGSVIAIDFLLSTQGALALRLLRRFIYERHSHKL
ncbi:MAG: hypothetical protein WAM98_10700, partial [Terriglobales bacterium]